MLKRFLGAAAGLAMGLSAMTAHAEDVLVFAAASLTNALNEIGEQFTTKTGHTLKASYAASSALAKQVEQGAPAQVFASADLKWMDYLASQKLINPDTRFNLLGNTLVLVAPLESKLDKVELSPKTNIAALAGDGRIATGNPDSVPVGLYFKQAMERAGQWQAVAPKIAAADSVRAALAFVERGEVPLGVVYATDAAVTKKVKVVGVFPDAMHDPIVYPFALITGKETPGAKALLEFIRTNQAKGVFAKYGFKVN
ncbi:MAG: molybdate ABC transporter substrate-binding protein [Rhodospirillaceae bacterium]|nr:molybdate ABC transporter substrate-binding protein [Rhodospirillales bacterium]